MVDLRITLKCHFTDIALSGTDKVVGQQKSSSFPHLFPLLCGVDVSYETPPFSTVLCVLP